MDQPGDALHQPIAVTAARADLHLHTSASDGDASPTELVEHAVAVRVDVIAVTDHDTLAGTSEAFEVGASLGVRVIPGCEFSVAGPGGELHLLGYFLSAEDAELEAFLDRQRSDRHRRASEIVSRLRGLGVGITYDDVLAVGVGDAIGRPHVARALVARGAVSGIQDAFDRYLAHGRAAFVPKRLPSLESVTALVRDRGGVTSAAHLGNPGPPMLDRLKRARVDGVEVVHPSHDAATTGRLAKRADALELLKTGGSDWHGVGGRSELGSHTVPYGWVDQMERRRQERVRDLGVTG